MHRPGIASKTPLAVAGILATPLFFVALMAMSLALEKPTVHHVVVQAKSVARLGDLSGSNEAAIWVSALAISAVVVLAGVAAMFVPRLGVVLPALSAIGVTLALLVQLDGWAHQHTSRYPDGIDLIPKGTTGDLLLRGEWEDSARQAAEQIGHWTIGLAGLAIVLSVVRHARRQRRPAPPPLATTGHASDGDCPSTVP